MEYLSLNQIDIFPRVNLFSVTYDYVNLVVRKFL